MIRPVLCAFALVLSSLSALADEKPKPAVQPGNRVDAKPIAGGQTVAGQPGIGARFDPFSLAYLQWHLHSEVVRDDLKMTDAQFADVKKAQEELQKKMQEMGKEFGEKLAKIEKQEDKVAASAEYSKKIQEVQAEAFKGLLKPEQVARLKQIAIQIHGPGAFATPEVAEKLKLTDEQKTKQRELMTQMGKDIQEAYKEMTKDGGKIDPEKWTAKVQDHQKKLLADITKELTAEQVAAWKELVGPKFDVEKFQKNSFRRPPIKVPAPEKPLGKPVEKPIEK